MTQLSEETALDLLEELMVLNNNIQDLKKLFQPKGIAIDEPSPPQKPAAAPEQQGPKKPVAVFNPDREPTLSVGNPKKKGGKGTYMFIGGPEYDTTVDLPACYAKGYDTPECLEKKDDCIHAELCSKFPSCYAKGHGSDECLEKIKDCMHDNHCRTLCFPEEDDEEDEGEDDYDVFECPNCNSLVKADDTECKNCGEKFDEEHAELVQEVEVEDEVETESEVESEVESESEKDPRTEEIEQLGTKIKDLQEE